VVVLVGRLVARIIFFVLLRGFVRAEVFVLACSPNRLKPLLLITRSDSCEELWIALER
jgi:hypothetical protein